MTSWAEGPSAPAGRLTLVPGLGLGPEAWRPTVARLQADRPVELAPLPGYGLPARGQDLDPRALAERLVRALGDRGRTVLVGHSASCQVVAHAAALAPDLTAALVLVGPTTDPRAASWPALGLRWLRTAGHETPRQIPTLVHQYARTTLPTILGAMDRARRDRIDETLVQGGRPLLVVRGRHDRICPADWADHLAGRSPGGSVRTLPAGGHMVPLTHGELLAPVLEDFLSRTVDPAGP